MRKMEKINKICNILSSVRRVVVVSHIDPDGDSIGSQVALVRGLRKIGKEAIIYTGYEIPSNLEFLVDENEATDDISEFPYDAIFILDCGDISRISKEVEDQLDMSKVTVNIDHHKSNTNFADVNLVSIDISSAAEIILNILDTLGVPITFDIALPLYVGMAMDTGNFTYSNTTPQSHRNAARLLTAGVDPYLVKRVLSTLESPSVLYLLSDSLKTVRIELEGKLALMYLTREMLKNNAVKLNNVNGFVEYPRMIDGVEVATLLIELKDGQTKINFRSHGNADVDNIANELGGGGHRSAAGCILEDTMEVAETKLVQTVEKYFIEKEIL